MGFCKHVREMFFCKDEPPGLSKEHLEAADRAFYEASDSESLRNLSILVFANLLHIPYYLSFYTNLFPVLASCVICLSNMLGFLGGFKLRKIYGRKAFNLMLALPFAVNHIALVLSETWVQKFLFYKAGSYFGDLREEPSCGGFDTCKAEQDAPKGTVCYNRVDNEQLWIIQLLQLYYILMILPASYGLLFLPALSMYVGLVILFGGRFDEGGWQTAAMVVITSLVCMWSKSKKESTSRMFFQALHSQHMQTIDEKVKRCEAEFKSDMLQESITKTLCEGAGANPNPEAPVSVSSWSNAVCPTHYSAPAACSIRKLDAWPEKACSGNDCLLATSQVYVDGASNALRELQDLEEGQRVLSVDDLTGCFEFVEVSSIQASACPDHVTRIVLEDDSVVELTADHPMQVFDRTLSATLSKCLPAGDLLPQIHSLSTWKRSKLKIKEVSTCQPADQVQVIAVSTSHPERYHMLVAGPKHQSHPNVAPSMTAVGFANLGVVDLTCRSSFLDVALPSGPALRRSASDPCLDGSKISGNIGLEKLGLAQPGSEKVDKRQLTKNVIPANGSMSETIIKDAQFEQVPLSVGSIGHHNGTCRPCNFQTRWLAGDPQSWGPCTQGFACNFCHETHERRRGRLKPKPITESARTHVRFRQNVECRVCLEPNKEQKDWQVA